MDTLNAENMEQAVVPASMQQIVEELKETVELLTKGMIADGWDAPTLEELPVWYVIGKAAGASGISVRELLNDPIARRFAIGIYVADLNATQKAKEAVEAKYQRMERTEARKG